MHILASEDMLSAFDTARRGESASATGADSHILPATPGHQRADSETLQYFDTLLGGVCTWNQRKQDEQNEHLSQPMEPSCRPQSSHMLGAGRASTGGKGGPHLLEDLNQPEQYLKAGELLVRNGESFTLRNSPDSCVQDGEDEGAYLSNIGVIDFDIDEPSSSSLTLGEGVGLSFILSSLCSTCSGSDSGTVKIQPPLDVRKSEEGACFSLLSAQEPWMPGNAGALMRPEVLDSNNMDQEAPGKLSGNVEDYEVEIGEGETAPKGSSTHCEEALLTKEIGGVDEVQPDSLEAWCHVDSIGHENGAEVHQGLHRVQVSIVNSLHVEDIPETSVLKCLSTDPQLAVTELDMNASPGEVHDSMEGLASGSAGVEERKLELCKRGGSAICTEPDEQTSKLGLRRQNWRLSSREDSEDPCGEMLGRFVEHRSDFGKDVRLTGMLERRLDWEESIGEEEEEEEEPLTARDLVCDSPCFLDDFTPGNLAMGPMSQWEDIDLSNPNFYSDSDKVESGRSSADGMEGNRPHTGGEMLEACYIATNLGEETNGEWVDEKIRVVHSSHTREACSQADHLDNDGLPHEPVRSSSFETLEQGLEAIPDRIEGILHLTSKELIENSSSDEGIDEGERLEEAGCSTSSGLPPGGGAPPARADSADLNSWEQMQEAMVVSKTMKRVLSCNSEQMDGEIWDENVSRLITVETEISAKEEREVTEPLGPEAQGGRGIHFVHHGDPFESLLDSPSAVGHKRLQTVLEESSMAEELLHTEKLDLSDGEGSITRVPAGEPWVFDRAGLSTQEEEDAWCYPTCEDEGDREFPGLFHIGACHRGRIPLSEGHKSCHISASGSKSALDVQQGTVLPSLEEVGRAQSAPCNLYDMFDGFSALDSEISEIFGWPTKSDPDYDMEERATSRQSDPGVGGAGHCTSRSLSPKEQILKWLRAKLNFRASPEKCSEYSGAEGGSLCDRNSCVGRMSSIQSHQSSEVISSISLSDMVTAPSPSPVQGPPTFDLIVNANIYEPIEWGPAGPRQLYGAVRPKLEASGMDVAKWDALSNEELPVIEFFDGIVQEAEAVGLDLFGAMEVVAGKDNALVVGLRDALGRGRPRQCCYLGGSDEFGQECSIDAVQWQVQLEEGRETLERAPSEMGRWTSSNCSFDLLDVLSECGINAMFFDRDMSAFSSESDYYGYLAGCLKSEGAKLTPELMSRLGRNHPLSVALRRESMALRGHTDPLGKKHKGPVLAWLRRIFGWRRKHSLKQQKPSQSVPPGCWNGLKKEVSRRMSRRHTVLLPL